MNSECTKMRAAISLIVIALVSILAVAGTADAKKKHKNKPPKPVTVTSTQTAAIPPGTPATTTGVFPTQTQVTPNVDGKAQTTITVPKKKNFPIKSVEVAAIVAPATPSSVPIGIELRLTGPSGARDLLNTPFRDQGGFPANDPGSPPGVGYGTGTSCSSGSPMRFTINSQRDPSSTNPNPAFDDPGLAEFTSFPPYTTPVFDNLNAVYKGLNSAGTWKLTALNPPTFGTPAPDTTSTLVCWSLTIKPQKLPKGESA
jgi:hypothetical protein